MYIDTSRKCSCVYYSDWVSRVGRTDGSYGARFIKGSWSMYDSICVGGVRGWREAFCSIYTPLYAPTFTITLRTPRPWRARATVFMHICYITVRVLTCRPGLLALQVHVGLYLGIVVRNGLADSHKPLDGQVHPLADPGYRPGRPLGAERSFPVRHQRRYL